MAENIDVLTSEHLLDVLGQVHRTPWHKAAAVFVSPEFYFDHNEAINGTGKGPEEYRPPWQSFYGVPVVVDPDLREGEYTVYNAMDIIQNMRVATDSVTDAMIAFAYKAAESNATIHRMLPPEDEH